MTFCFFVADSNTYNIQTSTWNEPRSKQAWRQSSFPGDGGNGRLEQQIKQLLYGVRLAGTYLLHISCDGHDDVIPGLCWGRRWPSYGGTGNVRGSGRRALDSGHELQPVTSGRCHRHGDEQDAESDRGRLEWVSSSVLLKVKLCLATFGLVKTFTGAFVQVMILWKKWDVFFSCG